MFVAKGLSWWTSYYCSSYWKRRSQWESSQYISSWAMSGYVSGWPNKTRSLKSRLCWFILPRWWERDCVYSPWHICLVLWSLLFLRRCLGFPLFHFPWYLWWFPRSEAWRWLCQWAVKCFLPVSKRDCQWLSSTHFITIFVSEIR